MNVVCIIYVQKYISIIIILLGRNSKVREISSQRKINNLGWLFIVIIAVYLLVMFIVQHMANIGIELPGMLLILMSEMALVIPGVIYMIINKLKFRNDLGFNRIKPGTIFMSLLFGFTVIPVVSFFNVLSQFFVPNTMVQATDSLASGSSALTIFIGGILGPLCEEFIFRGIFANEYSKYSTSVKAMIMSGLLFGLMHLNFNQLCYAFVLGLLFFIVNKASGSTYTSFIAHAAVNIPNLAGILLMNLYMKNSGAEVNLAEAAEVARTSNQLIIIAVVYFVLAIIFGALSILCLRVIAKNEGREQILKGMFARKNKDNENASYEVDTDVENTKVLLNIPAIIAIVGTIIMIVVPG